MNPAIRLLITMGDVAGIGPEIIARAWPQLASIARPVVVGDPHWLAQALRLVGSCLDVVQIAHPSENKVSSGQIPCIHSSRANLSQVRVGQVSAAAGQAAFDFLSQAIEWTLQGSADAIVTCPLHKEGLRAAGLHYPGHTEILAEKTGSNRFGMVLYCRRPAPLANLGVVHVTLHMALKVVFQHLTPEAVLEKIVLLDSLLRRLCERPPRIAVAALNPHASDGGLFGNEEETVIGPAVLAAQQKDIMASGPWPSDTLFVRAARGDFDGIVAMYHDQGHIALKLLAGTHAVNITVGLPIIRTSVAHGTAYDIAGKGIADAQGLVEAAQVACALSQEK